MGEHVSRYRFFISVSLGQSPSICAALRLGQVTGNELPACAGVARNPKLINAQRPISLKRDKERLFFMVVSRILFARSIR
ncbi:hypothetical protein BEN30_03105 [Magnetovibrio blakemorei]|uniref:Uncharacterized protein n=1 Tax=Magnetovibrio blakemorei TaxID=28181 RepID=A0A1E5QBK9_9PROT|nr:hypothetical protein BEN30_03105 [Magnetovibrio blakemorei]